MADVVEKIRAHTQLVKSLNSFRRQFLFVDLAKAERLHRAEVEMMKAENDGRLILLLNNWFDILGEPKDER